MWAPGPSFCGAAGGSPGEVCPALPCPGVGLQARLPRPLWVRAGVPAAGGLRDVEHLHCSVTRKELRAVWRL